MIKHKEATDWVPPFHSSPFLRFDRQWMEQRSFEIEETERVQSFENSRTLAEKLFILIAWNVQLLGLWYLENWSTACQ
jgi:hypothetical protein